MRIALQSLFRSIFWLFAIFAGLLIATSITLYLFFDPNHYKPQISTFLQKQTGLPLVIEGDMHLTLFPWIGLKVEKLSLQDLATIQELDLEIPLRELLTRNLIIKSLKIKGADLNLTKDQNGKVNWETYSTSFRNKPNHNAKKENIPQSSSTNKTFSFALKQVDIKNSKITFVDHQAQRTWVIDHLNLSGDYSSTHPIPLEATFNLSLAPFKKEALLIAKAALEGTIIFYEKKPIIDLKTEFSFDLPKVDWEHTKLHAQLKGDLSKKITLGSLNLQSGKIEAIGNVTIPIETSKAINFSLNINDLDIDKLKSLSQSTPQSTMQTKSTASASKAAVTSSSPTLTERVIQGELSIDKLKYDKYHLTNIKTSVRKQGKTVTLSPFMATLYHGTLKASIAQTGIYSELKGSLTNLPVQSLLQSLNKPEKLSGQANIEFNLSQQGKNDPTGVIKCQITNGIIHGIDVDYYIDLAQSLIKKQNNTLSDTKQTSFDVLSATLMLHDNIIDNNDLKIVSRNFMAKAEGSVYLTDQTLAYKLQANKIYYDGKEHPNAYPLAIRIKGPIQNPKIEPDLDVYLKKLAELELKNKVKKLLGQDSTSSENEPNQDLKSKIEKEMGRGLKKILKLP